MRRPRHGCNPVGGATLFAAGGEWSGAEPMRLSYRPQNCLDDEYCEDIVGATEEAIQAGDAEVATTPRVRVEAVNETAMAAFESELTAPVEHAPDPKNARPPAITLLGGARSGATAITDGGGWSDAGKGDFNHQWQQCRHVHRYQR